jgi:hypothetical protein
VTAGENRYSRRAGNPRRIEARAPRTITRTITVREARNCGKLKGVYELLEWRNWQTHGTQNPALFTEHEGSTPSSSTTS